MIGAGRVFETSAHRRLAVVVALLLVGGISALTIGVWSVIPSIFDPVWLQDRIAATGPAAPLVFVAIQITQVVVAPIPGQVLGAVGGYLFGSLHGTLYSMVGVVIGSCLVFAAGRRYGRPFMVRLVTEATITRFDGFIDQHGTRGLFILFLLPTFPDDVICLVAGLTNIRFRTFLALIVVGRTPGFLATAYAGTNLAEGRVDIFLTITVALLIVSFAIYYYRQEISVLSSSVNVDGPR